MNHFTDMLSDAVLSKKLEVCSLEELQSLSEKHPYASALQLLYAKKLKEANDERYAKQFQQTLLYYKNPLLINHLIETDGQNNTILSSTLKESKTLSLRKIFHRKKKMLSI
ncbi:hypothetical protein [Niabella ginsengisoli]|uniref:Uncharacterized protein n=1 Tax=Niabella ginsengisoli TaxID=522298 RepID=A0ABS9SH18_9BACT|nr:hypothetical protein [Niabella ginsengisoli]MCH5597659.1 hypothetical protein [Niabella ginsengisoli]